MVAGIAGDAGLGALEQGAAAGKATVTMHNATCARPLSGRAIYDTCHKNGVGCIDFYFRGRSLRTNAKGRATRTVGAGTLAIGQQKSRVSKSTGISVYCSAMAGGKTTRVLFEGRADAGEISIDVKAGEQIVCDWYNITEQSFALPQQCPGHTTPPPATTTTTTTAAPTTTTTTTVATIACPPPTVCSSDSDCSALGNAYCASIANGQYYICLCNLGYYSNADGNCAASAATGVGKAICDTALNKCGQICNDNCSALGLSFGYCATDGSGNALCVGGYSDNQECSSDSNCTDGTFTKCTDFGLTGKYCAQDCEPPVG